VSILNEVDDPPEAVVDLRDPEPQPSTPLRYLLSPPDVGKAERDALLAAFDSGWIAPIGPQLDEFESAFAALIGAPSALAVGSGTAAIHLALKLVGVGVDDDVVVSSLTFAASANPVRYLGANPVFVDSELDTWNMDPDLLDDFLLERANNGRLPAAVVVVDIFGQCAQLSRIRNICKAYDVPLVEDAAEALGATHRGQAAGSFGRLGAFSFNGNKTITTSGGGMLVGSVDDIDRARFLSTQAKEPVPWYEHNEVGFNYRMSNILAGMGLAQLERLSELVACQRQVKSWYRSELRDVDEIKFMPEFTGGKATNWLTALTIEGDAVPEIETLRQRMNANGIEARAVWKPLHMQPAFSGCQTIGRNVSETLFATGLCLPSGTRLTRDDVGFISRSLKSALRSGASSKTSGQRPQKPLSAAS